MASLLPIFRARMPRLAAQTTRYAAAPFSTTRVSKQRSGTEENREQPNDPNPSKDVPNVSKTNELAIDAMGNQDAPLQEMAQDAEKQRQLQSPNRAGVWSRSQQPREVAMTGPRFEQTIMELQPQPYAAIELIHQQPVRWVKERQVACDGGGGPLGHPKIFINLDKPQICWCTYCGLPYANTHHKKYLESLPHTSYPLQPTGDPAQVEMPKTPSQRGEIQGTYPTLKGELNAEGVDGQPFAQR